MNEFLNTLITIWNFIEPYLPSLIGMGGVIGAFFGALKRFKEQATLFGESEEVKTLAAEVRNLKSQNSKLCKDNDGLRKDIAALITALNKVEYKPTNTKED